MTVASVAALEALVRAADMEGAVRLCAFAPGSAVHALRARLDAWLIIDFGRLPREPQPDGSVLVRMPPCEIDGSAAAWRAGRAARFALHDAEDARRNGFLHTPSEAATLALVARVRGRRWATSIAAAYCERWPGARTWQLVRPWILAGLCDRPDGDGYLQSLLATNGVSPGGPAFGDRLLADPGLLEDEIWRLFTIEGGGQNSFAACDKYGARANTWSTALAQLAAEGRLSRNRLLDAALDALARDFAQFRAGWFSRFHDLLAPTDEELAARTDRYVRLLGSRRGPTVSMALRCLMRLDRAKQLPARAFLDSVPDTLRSRTKATVVAVLRMLDRVARREPAFAAEVARAAAIALSHDAADVQGAALDVIERRGAADDAALRAAVAACAPTLAATLRGRVAPFVGEARTDAAPGDATVVSVAPVPPEPPLDEALRSPSRLIEPITDFADLVAAFARVVECFDADLFEQVLGAAARHGPPRDDSQRTLAAPLARRAARVGERGIERSFVPSVARLAATWACGAPWTYGLDVRSEVAAVTGWAVELRSSHVEAAARLPSGSGDPPMLYDWEPLHLFVEARLRAVADSVLAGRRAALLSTPTHVGGWIDPVALAERVRDGNAIDDVHDRVLALLRVAPERRDEGLARLKCVPGEFAAALRHALGSPDETIGPTATLWIAAARARAPFDDDARVGAVHAGLGPDAADAARYDLPTLPAPDPKSLPYPHDPCFVVRLPWPPRPVASWYPTVLAHAAPDGWGRGFDGAGIRWWMTVTPSNHEPLFALAIEMLLASYEVAFQLPELVAPLTGPNVRWDGLAPHALAVALGAPSADVRNAAIDALVEAATRGRLPSARLGEGLAWTLTTGRVPCGRMAKSLTQTAAASGRHAAFVADAIEASLVGDRARWSRDLLALLELLLELRTRGRTRVTAPAARQFLAGIPGGGRAARVAAALIGAVLEFDRGDRKTRNRLRVRDT